MSLGCGHPDYLARRNAKLNFMYNELRCNAFRVIFKLPCSGIINTSLFPKNLIDVVLHISSHSEVDIGSVLLTILGCISTALCGRYIVNIDNEWREPCCLYIVIAAPSGFRKSYIIQILKGVFDSFFAELNEEFDNESSRFDRSKECIDQLKRQIISAYVRSHVKDAMADGIYSGDPKQALANLEMSTKKIDELADSSKPKFSSAPQIFLSKISSVTAGATIARQGEYGCVFEAEGGFFEGEIAHKSTHPGLYLKAYDMERYDYSSQKIGKISMRCPAMNITTFVQPDVLMRFYSNRNLKERGLNARFLPLFSTKNSTPSMLNPATGSMLDYNSRVSKMLRRNFSQDKGRKIFDVSVTPEAYARIKGVEQLYKQEVEARRFSPINRKKFEMSISSFLSKAHGSIVRLALAIHAWNYPEPEQYPITLEEVEAAISMMDVIIAHAHAAFNHERSQACYDAQLILDWISRCDWTNHSPVFESHKAMEAISGLNKKQCHVALDLLEEHGYIKQLIEAGHDRICVLHPQLVEQFFHPIAMTGISC